MRLEDLEITRRPQESFQSLGNMQVSALILRGLKQMSKRSFIHEEGCIFLPESEMLPYETDYYVLNDIIFASTAAWRGLEQERSFSIYGADSDGPWLCGLNPSGVAKEEEIRFIEIPGTSSDGPAEMLFRDLIDSDIVTTARKGVKIIIKAQKKKSSYIIELDSTTERLEHVSLIIGENSENPTCCRWEILYPGSNYSYVNAVSQFKKLLVSSDTYVGKKLTEWEGKNKTNRK